MSTNYDGLTRNTWPGTWSSSGTHPIVLDREVRGSLRYISGDSGDRLTDIEGQRLQEGMLVYVKNTYGSITGDKYYTYKLQSGESRDASTGAVPNNTANWTEVTFGGSGSSVSALSELTNDVGFITDFNISVAGDDSTLRKIDSGEGIVFTGGANISVSSDTEGNITITNTQAVPTKLSDLTNDVGYITSTEEYNFKIGADDSTARTVDNGEQINILGGTAITTTSDAEGNITIAGVAQDFAYASLTGTPTIPSDVSDLTDNTNLLSAGGSDFSLVLAADDSNVRTITSGETVQFNGGHGITTFSNSSGDITIESNLDGMGLDLGTPSDGSLVTPGALSNWTQTYKVTNSIDDLNELALNIINDTAVANVDFVSDIVSGGAGSVITLTITADGNPTHYIIDWGDGTPPETTTDSTPSHTYPTAGTYTITVTAYNNSGEGAGARVSKTRNAYIVIATADPVVTFAAYAALTGGSAITQWDDGDTVYFENTTTNIGSATIQFTWDWGDSESDDVITDDTAAGGTAGARIAHTFTASTEQEQTRTVTLTLDSHSTADPAVIPTDDTNDYKIYDTHTPTVGLSTTSGINEESTSGLPVTFTNNTETTIGSYATYGIQYRYTFGDGTTQTVNVGSGASGDTGGTISKTYTLSSSDQANGNSADFTGNIRVISDHGSSPFISSDFTVHVEPDVRANIAGTAVTVSDATGDNQYDLYDGNDYNGNNRALVRLTNTTQNGDDYVYDWADTSSDDTMTESGGLAGSTAATIDHDYAGETAGGATYNVSFTANGTPDITAQSDVDTSLTFTLNNVPANPAYLSTKSITLVDAYQGTLPKLAHGFTDNSASNPLSAGASLTTTTARRYTSGTIDTTVVNDAYVGHTGTLAANINGTDTGTKTFTTTLNETGTFTSLVISQNVDYNDIDGSYPTGFYQVFDAKITETMGDYSVGVNDQRLAHTTTGNTNYVSVVKDDLTATPTFGSTGTLSEGTGGTKRYISGIPYYNTGSPNLTLSGVTINDLVGQCYTDQSNIVEVDPGTNYESTTSSAIQFENYTYANIDGATTMLSSGIPKVNTGTSTAYAIGNLTVDITSSSVRTVESPRIRSRNVNGVSSYTNLSTKVQVHTAAQSGINETAIPVNDSLGSGFDDDGVRIFDFSAATTDTPSYTSSTNFYTNSLYSESSDPGVEGTQEATVRLGVLQHDVTDYSSGYLPVGPDRSSDTGTQYFTFAFRRTVTANVNFTIVSSTGIEGLFIAAPGTDIDDTSTLNGWLDCGIQYAGVGAPGADTGNGGNGSNGCALTGSDRIGSGALNGTFEMTLGNKNLSDATGNVMLVRVALASGDTLTSFSVS